MHLMSVAGIPFYHAVDLISRNCLAGCSGLTAALGNYVLVPTGLHPQLAYSRVIPLDLRASLMYKIINDMVDINVHQQFRPSNTTTRGHHQRFLQLPTRVDAYELLLSFYNKIMEPTR